MRRPGGVQPACPFEGSETPWDLPGSSKEAMNRKQELKKAAGSFSCRLDEASVKDVKHASQKRECLMTLVGGGREQTATKQRQNRQLLGRFLSVPSGRRCHDNKECFCRRERL